MVARAFALMLSVVSGLLLFGLFQGRYLHMKTKQELANTKAQLTECNTKIDVQNAKIEAMRADYEKKLKEFKKQKTKVKKIYEPLQIEIPHTDDECQALKQMLDEYRKAERSIP